MTAISTRMAAAARCLAHLPGFLDQSKMSVGSDVYVPLELDRRCPPRVA